MDPHIKCDCLGFLYGARGDLEHCASLTAQKYTPLSFWVRCEISMKPWLFAFPLILKRFSNSVSGLYLVE